MFGILDAIVQQRLTVLRHRSLQTSQEGPHGGLPTRIAHRDIRGCSWRCTEYAFGMNGRTGSQPLLDILSLHEVDMEEGMDIFCRARGEEVEVMFVCDAKLEEEGCEGLHVAAQSSKEKSDCTVYAGRLSG
ncbi:hypothetical protein BC629DRAFT_1516927 [Irpex lacteus]|nr:hypothetical protein BC629DRAFT_1516927 [Irpex lacteus]